MNAHCENKILKDEGINKKPPKDLITRGGLERDALPSLLLGLIRLIEINDKDIWRVSEQKDQEKVPTQLARSYLTMFLETNNL